MMVDDSSNKSDGNIVFSSANLHEPRRGLFYVVAFLLCCTVVDAQIIEGKVIAISDGDTFTCLTASKSQLRVRLHGIDCPERRQDFGTAAKQFLSDLIYGKTVTLNETDYDRYGRMIAIVFVEGLNVNETLLKEGLAWHYKYFDQNESWAALELKAKGEKKGLWVYENPIAPWEFRRTR